MCRAHACRVAVWVRRFGDGLAGCSGSEPGTVISKQGVLEICFRLPTESEAHEGFAGVLLLPAAFSAHGQGKIDYDGVAKYGRLQAGR